MSIPEVNPRQYAHNFKKVPGRILEPSNVKKEILSKPQLSSIQPPLQVCFTRKGLSTEMVQGSMTKLKLRLRPGNNSKPTGPGGWGINTNCWIFN